jgi:hypothetical protein
MEAESRREVSESAHVGTRPGKHLRSAEKGREERVEVYEITSVISRDALGARVVLPILLHDRSPRGLGGVYVGEDAPDTRIDYWHEASDGQLLRMRLIWIERLANHVFILGFAIL